LNQQLNNMEKPTWIDGTLQTPFVRIQVTNSHVHYKGIWVMHVREFYWNCKDLKISSESTQKDAQKAALKIVRNHVADMLLSLKGI